MPHLNKNCTMPTLLQLSNVIWNWIKHICQQLSSIWYYLVEHDSDRAESKLAKSAHPSSSDDSAVVALLVTLLLPKSAQLSPFPAVAVVDDTLTANMSAPLADVAADCHGTGSATGATSIGASSNFAQSAHHQRAPLYQPQQQRCHQTHRTIHRIATTDVITATYEHKICRHKTTANTS